MTPSRTYPQHGYTPCAGAQAPPLLGPRSRKPSPQIKIYHYTRPCVWRWSRRIADLEGVLERLDDEHKHELNELTARLHDRTTEANSLRLDVDRLRVSSAQPRFSLPHTPCSKLVAVALLVLNRGVHGDGDGGNPVESAGFPRVWV